MRYDSDCSADSHDESECDEMESEFGFQRKRHGVTHGRVVGVHASNKLGLGRVGDSRDYVSVNNSDLTKRDQIKYNVDEFICERGSSGVIYGKAAGEQTSKKLSLGRVGYTGQARRQKNSFGGRTR